MTAVATKSRPRRKPPLTPWQRWSRGLPSIPGYDPELTAAPGDYFDADAAEHAIGFIQECCQHIEGSVAGQPFMLEPWQKILVGCLFGWKRKDGTRRYRKLFLYVARGNGKTPLLAAIMLYLLYADGEPGAQIYLIASRADQAALSYRHARGMVEREPMMNDVSQIFKGTGHRSITLLNDQAAFIRVFPSDAAGIHGQMPHAVGGDELHAWAGREAMDAIKTSFAKKGRRQPLQVYATTADYDRPSVCNEEYSIACSVRDNGGDPNKPGFDRELLPVIYEAKIEDDWTAEDVWEKANPNIDVTVSREALREYVRTAKEQPSMQAEFKRLHLNIRTTAQTIYIPLERWDACPQVTSMESLNGRECYCGLDISSKQDITAFVMVFPPLNETDPYVLKPIFWIPRENMREKEKIDRVPYSVWAEQGFIRPMDGFYTKLIDHTQVLRDIQAEAKTHRIKIIGYDPWNIGNLPSDIKNSGIEVIEFGQNIKNFNHPTKELDNLVLVKRIDHFANPVLRWMLGCTEIWSDSSGNRRPVKPDSKTGKRIDGIVASIMGLGLALTRQESTPEIILI